MRRIEMDSIFLNLALYFIFVNISTEFLLFQGGYCPLNNISCFQSSLDATSYDGILLGLRGSERRFRNATSVHLGTFDRHTNRPTNYPKNQQADMRVHREVTLPKTSFLTQLHEPRKVIFKSFIFKRINFAMSSFDLT